MIDGFTLRFRDAVEGMSYEQISGVCRASWDTVSQWYEGRKAPHPRARESVFTALARWKETPWPGFCQTCRAALNPPNATSCKACGADDIDD